MSLGCVTRAAGVMVGSNSNRSPLEKLGATICSGVLVESTDSFAFCPSHCCLDSVSQCVTCFDGSFLCLHVCTPWNPFAPWSMQPRRGSFEFENDTRPVELVMSATKARRLRYKVTVEHFIAEYCTHKLAFDKKRAAEAKGGMKQVFGLQGKEETCPRKIG
jgi:hypothetical protein